MSIVLEDLTKRYGGHPVVSSVSLEVGDGELFVLLGSSGSGKSTLLRMIAGLSEVDAGRVTLRGRDVTDLPPAKRGVGFVFQSYALFRGMPVAENVEFGLKMRRVSRTERRRTAREILIHVGLGDFLDHYPHQLSGGMQQRVNLARVLVNRPRVILMDEPFCSLDAQTRLQMQEMLLALWHELHMTVVFVTHDVDEAVFLSDRVVVLSERPGTIKAELAVELPRPRTLDLLTSPEFSLLKRRAFELLLRGTARAARS
jgi:ABC-type nitrate/sulfonate/bicarbonate transport system ATPase subunit